MSKQTVTGQALERKLSIKTVFGAVPYKELDTDTPYWLMRVIGTCTGMLNGSTDKGEFVAFIGRFKAINLDSNKAFYGSKLFLPKPAEAFLIASLSDHEGGVTFAVDVGAVEDESTPVHYRYVIANPEGAIENDPIDAMEAKITANLKALPAPKKEVSKAAKAA